MFSFVQSDLINLRKEIAYDEAKMDMAFSITKNISTKQTIEGAKFLSEQFNVNKAAGKGLFLEAKEALLTSGDEFARTETLLKKKIIDCAQDIQKQRIEKREDKKREKDKQKQLELSQPSSTSTLKDCSKGRSSTRGLTIRDAYEVVEATKKQRGNSVVAEENSYNMDNDVDLQSLDIDDGKVPNCDFSPDGRSTATVNVTAGGGSRAGEFNDTDNTHVLKSAYGKTSRAEALLARQKKTAAPAVKKSTKPGPPSRSNQELELESGRLRNLLNNKKCLAGYKVSLLETIFFYSGANIETSTCANSFYVMVF